MSSSLRARVKGAFDLQQIIQRLHPAARPVELNFHRELRSLLTPARRYTYTLDIANGLYELLLEVRSRCLRAKAVSCLT